MLQKEYLETVLGDFHDQLLILYPFSPSPYLDAAG